MKRVGQGLVGAALLIAAVTVVARVVGFLRVVVLARTVGTTCLGDVYTTANAVPNIVYEVVVGGALSAAVVPLVAASVARGRPDLVRATTAALHGWALLLLVPLTAATYLLSGPIVRVLLGSSNDCADALMHQTAQEMLWVFALQIPVYGATVVAQGSLQAHRRFLAPALAPLLSSLVVIGAYLAYAEVAGAGRGSLASLTSQGFWLLALGTTLGVFVLLLAQVPSLWRAGLLVRPSLRFPGDVGGAARSLAVGGITVVGAQWVAYAAAIRLANVHGPEGAVVVLTLAWTVFLLPWAVLVFPVATSVFPELSGRFGDGDLEGFARTTAVSLRSVLLLSSLGAAGLAAGAEPLSRLMVAGVPGAASVDVLSDTLTAFALGVVGYGLQGLLSRVVAARHQAHLAALAAVVGWAVGLVLATVGAGAATTPAVVPSIGRGLSLGMLVGAGVLLVATVRAAGTPAAAGLPRTALAAALASLGSVAAGRWVAHSVSGTTTWQLLGELLLVGGVVGGVFVGLASAADWPTARRLLRRRARAGTGEARND